LKVHRERKNRDINPSNAKMNFEQPAAVHMQRSGENVSFKKCTRCCWKGSSPRYRQLPKIRRIRRQTPSLELGVWLSQTSVEPIRATKGRLRPGRHAVRVALLA
jgi:hypothetical protein